MSAIRRGRLRRAAVMVLGLAALLAASAVRGRAAAVPETDLEGIVRKLAAFEDRSTGTDGCREAAAFIRRQLGGGGSEVQVHRFALPVRRYGASRLALSATGRSISLFPLNANYISPGTVPPPGIEGPLIYVGTGELEHFNGKPVAGSIVVMDIDSGRNWLHAASLGAEALIYVDSGPTPNLFFKDKHEMSPIRFPRFWLPREELESLCGPLAIVGDGPAAEKVRLTSEAAWEVIEAQNIYSLVPGGDPELKDELVIVEAFYDSTAWVAGRSPGAEEALSAATLLELARALRNDAPARSVLLVATGGHGQTLAGMRELVWGLSENSKNLMQLKRSLSDAAENSERVLAVLDRARQGGAWRIADLDTAEQRLLKEALDDQVKTEVDAISQRLIRLRMQENAAQLQGQIQQLARERLRLRRLGWRTEMQELAEAERRIVQALLPAVVDRQRQVRQDARGQLERLASARRLRALVRSLELQLVVSLHLSSHGDGVGAFNQGGLYPLKTSINRIASYSTLDEVIRRSAAEGPAGELYQDTLRPDRMHPWESYLGDRPRLGGEVSALAGYLGVSLATTHDGRLPWGTPYDTTDRLDWDFARAQSRYVIDLLRRLAEAETLQDGPPIRKGIATVTGRANFLRHGELFPDQPAPGSIILAFQGPAHYHTAVDARGIFRLKGMADKRHVLGKVIIEGYRFDPDTGETLWAIDKEQTGKSAYRVRMRRSSMETDLVMFACKQTTFFSLLEPRNFNYMTKIQLIDARREAQPLRRWWSRIDTRDSVINSLYLESGTRLKLTLSDTVLRKKMILTGARGDRPQGAGYLVDDWPKIHKTQYRTARDMWALLAPRIDNLEQHGIYNERIRDLQDRGITALQTADAALSQRRYDDFVREASKSWALASRVYDHVESTQKDVLFGVLFYIALFVPFAFCMERLLFAYSDIHRRILAFGAILLLLIAVIYNVHPAFELAYSPTVVILAFFIMGLSLIVTLIIFLRFEEEMSRLQRRASTVKLGEVSRWKAFTAAFFLGVSNLRRRRLRTVLTCSTLIILTFTIMSFTTVKTIRHRGRLLYQPQVPYQGFLLKTANWSDLPTEALDSIANAFGQGSVVAPRVWLEPEDRTRPIRIPLRRQGRIFEARGLVGLSADEGRVTQLEKGLTAGRWFRPEERQVVLISERMAETLDINLRPGVEETLTLWGSPFRVVGIFSGQALHRRPDLDGEPLTPVIFPHEISREMTEEEMEAWESGEDVRAFQSRYDHIDEATTVILPYRTLLAAGGKLKSVAVRPAAGEVRQDVADALADRFGLSLFAGEADGTFLYTASDTLSYSGVPYIVVPVLISIFIVLNTMIGSVYERKREIGIYTSVGLAPSHVSFLFIAESLAFAVLSVVLGYLLAQTTAAVFSGTAFWSGITVNYSSLAGVGAMVLVIGVVLVSVLYPSRVAAEIAIPDVNRSWKMPEPQQNTIVLTLPFLIKESEQRSVGGFLLEHFRGHQEVSHGLFSTGDIAAGFQRPAGAAGQGRPGGKADAPQRPALVIRASVWLAPFDFGVKQSVRVDFLPSADEAGFFELRLRLEREAGEANIWGRINRVFVNDLRKHLLIWRSLDEMTQDSYRRGVGAAMATAGATGDDAGTAH